VTHEETVSAVEAALMLKFSMKHIYELVRLRRLAAVKRGREWRIYRAAVDAKLAERELRGRLARGQEQPPGVRTEHATPRATPKPFPDQEGR
jgi:excisionase family DNA binding protein